MIDQKVKDDLVEKARPHIERKLGLPDGHSGHKTTHISESLLYLVDRVEKRCLENESNGGCDD